MLFNSSIPLTFLFFFLAPFFLAIHPGSFVVDSAPTTLRIMAFNTWNTGSSVDDGLAKIAKHISFIQPDIVALQEITSLELTTKLTTLLGPKIWKIAVHPDADNRKEAILTRHKFFNDPPLNVPLSAYEVSASVLLESPPGQVINFFSFHPDTFNYGPYALYNKTITKKEEIYAREKGRVQSVVDLLADAKYKEYAARTDKEPLIVAGDFNSPSHLDYLEETKAVHNGWVLEWPATKMLEDAGLTDSYRELYPNVTQNPGLTWSTVYKSYDPEKRGFPEPQDRIDFVLYKSAQLKPIKAIIYSGNETINEMPNPSKNDWPSDHYALVMDFAWEAEGI